MADKKQCFVISPIGKPGSETRRLANWFLNGIVKPALEEEFEVRRADDDHGGEIITTKVIERIKEADLVIADMSESNPNVFYELGVAHSFERRVIQMIRGDASAIPFDVNPVRTLSYTVHEFDDLERYREALWRAVQDTMKADKVRNPVTQAQGVAQLSTGADSQKELIETLAAEVAELKQALRPRAVVIDRLLAENRAPYVHNMNALPVAEFERMKRVVSQARGVNVERMPKEAQEAFWAALVARLSGIAAPPDDYIINEARSLYTALGRS
jgi:hypothetical protein